MTGFVLILILLAGVVFWGAETFWSIRKTETCPECKKRDTMWTGSDLYYCRPCKKTYEPK